MAGYDNALVISLSRRLVLLQALRAWTEAELATHGIIDQAEFEAVAGGLFETSTGNHAIWLVPNGIQSYVFPPNEPGAGVDLLHTDPPEKALDSLAALSTHELVVSLPEATPSSLELQARLAIYSQSHFWSLVTIAITSDRVYRPAWPPERAHQYILQNSGLLFDPQVVDRFFKIEKERSMLYTGEIKS